MTEIYIPLKALLSVSLAIRARKSFTPSQESLATTKSPAITPTTIFASSGTGDKQGLYALKIQVTGKVIFSRTSQAPYVSHVDGNGDYSDNWFKLEPGTGKYAKHFRLLCPATDTVIYSRTGRDTNLPKVKYSEGPWGDQYFSFSFEDMKIDKIEYDLKLGKIISSTPMILANQTLKNTSDVAQELRFDVSETETHTSTFNYSTGFTLAVGTTIKGGVPFVAEAEMSVSASVSQEMKFGVANSFSKTYTVSLPVKAGPRSVVHTISTVNKGDIQVPFTIFSSSKSAGVKVDTKGMWRGVSTWEIRHTISVDAKK